MSRRHAYNREEDRSSLPSSMSLGGPSTSGAKQPPPPRSWANTICMWTVVIPLMTLLIAIAVPLSNKYHHMADDQPYSLMTNQTVLDFPSNFHSRFRGGDYIQQYDRFFFQWWNFLVYDAETHDHWTMVYHTTKYSSAAQYADYASASMVHKTGPVDILSVTDAIPLADLEHTKDWDLGLRKPDGTVPYRMTVIDDDTYNVQAVFDADLSSTKQVVLWNLTFHRVHGMYSGVDTEEGNKDNCAVVSTLFGYHSKVSGWIQEGEKRWEFGTTGAAGSRYRAYAAGSWGCKLPAGYPEIQYPWTWTWLVIPADETLTPPRPEIGLVLGTARFQLNVTLLGDLYGGYASFGVGSNIVTSSFASLHHGTAYEVPLTKASTDEYLRVYELEYANWTTIEDESGTYSVPLMQTYEVETVHYRLRAEFTTRPEQYFRLPVVLEHLSTADALLPNPKHLAVFSDFRACGVQTHITLWHRERSLVQQALERRSEESTSAAETTAPEDEFSRGGWDTVIYDGEVRSLNAIEFAYQAPLTTEAYIKMTAPQKFATK